MRKIFSFLVLLIVWVNSYSRTIYFSTSGNDLTGNGNIGTPYASLGKASSVSVIGDAVHGVAGVYIQTTQVTVPIGVNIEGEGDYLGGTQITLTYNFPGGGFNVFNQAAVMFTSPAEGTNGNQSISNIWFDGNNYACLAGVLNRCRSNIIMFNCQFTRFGIVGYNLNGKLSNQTGTPPSVFSTGNQVINCSFFDCNDRITQTANSVSCGNISYSGQGTLLFQNDTAKNLNKMPGHNGDLWAAIQGNNYGVKWIGCVLQKPTDEGNGFNFGIESWYDMGGCEFSYNTYIGAGNVIDVGYGGANKGDSSYSWYVHHNTIPNPSLLTFNNLWPVASILISFECSTNTTFRPQNTTIGDARVEYNTLNNMGTLGSISLNNFASDFIKHIYFNHNICSNMGYANNSYSGIFNFTNSNGTLVDSIFIDNNTLLSNTGAGGSKAVCILQPNVGLMSHIFFRNNIANNVVSGYGYFVFRGNYATDRVFLQNNITFNNAFTNNPYTLIYVAGAGNFIVGKSYTISNIGTTNFTLIGASSNTPGVVFTALGVGSGTGSATFNASNITPTNFTNTGNIKSDPLFISTTDFHLQASSPGVSGGLNPPATYIGALQPGTTTPTISWTPTTPITYGTLLGAAQLNAVAMDGVTVVPGTHVYSIVAGTLLNAGTYTITDIFIPTNQSLYSVVSATTTIVVNKQPTTMSYSGLTVGYNGLPQSPTIITNPAGLSGVSTTFNGTGSLPVAAGSYTVVSGLNNQNYSAPNITATFTITKAPATIHVTNTVQQYDSTLKNVTVTTTPVGLATTITGAPQRYKGIYSLHIQLNEANYTATAIDTTLTITLGQTTVSWTPANLTYPTPTGAGQTNATSPKPAVFVYTPPSGTLLNSGPQSLRVDVTPLDTNIAPILGVIRTINVSQGTTTITVSNTTQFFDNTPKPITASAGQSGTLTILYNGSPTPPTAVGDYPFTVTFSSANYTAAPVSGTLHIISNAGTIFITNYANLVYIAAPISVTVTSPYSHTTTYNGSATPPTNVGNYTVIATINDGIHTGADTVTMTIIKANQAYTWPAISPIANPTPLSGTQLNITSPVSFSAAYNPVSGTILSPGTYTLSATITPTDGANYNTIVVTNTITVTAGTAVINVSNTSQTYNGLPHPITATTTPPNLDSLDITYGITHTPPKDAGSYPFTVRLINGNVTAPPVSGTLTIAQGTYTLRWIPPLPIQQNSTITAGINNATSTIAGTFTYNYPIGSIMSNPGTIALIATFHPTDSVNYGVQTITVPLSVFGSPFDQFYISHGNDTYLNLPGQNSPIPLIP